MPDNFASNVETLLVANLIVGALGIGMLLWLVCVLADFEKRLNWLKEHSLNVAEVLAEFILQINEKA